MFFFQTLNGSSPFAFEFFCALIGHCNNLSIAQTALHRKLLYSVKIYVGSIQITMKMNQPNIFETVIICILNKLNLLSDSN